MHKEYADMFGKDAKPVVFEELITGKDNRFSSDKREVRVKELESNRQMGGISDNSNNVTDTQSNPQETAATQSVKDVKVTKTESKSAEKPSVKKKEHRKRLVVKNTLEVESATGRNSEEKKTGYKSVRDVADNVLDELHELFDCDRGNADLIAALVYINSDGACEISKNAMAMVERFKGIKYENQMRELALQKKILKEVFEIVTRLEFGEAAILADREYSLRVGGQRPANPKNFDLRGHDDVTIDMLESLRRYGNEQIKRDTDRKGREIHQSKGKNDYEG